MAQAMTQNTKLECKNCGKVVAEQTPDGFLSGDTDADRCPDCNAFLPNVEFRSTDPSEY